MSGDILRDLSILRRFAEDEVARLVKEGDAAQGRIRQAIEEGTLEENETATPMWLRSLAETHRCYVRKIKRMIEREEARDLARSVASRDEL